MADQQEKKNEQKAAIGTAIVVAGVFVFCLLVGFTQPDPLPEEPYVELDFSNSSEGGGSEAETEDSSPAQEVQEEQPEETPQTAEIESESQVEESVAVDAAPVKDEKAEEPVEKPREVDPTTLFKPTESEGTETNDGGDFGNGAGTGSGDNTGPGHGTTGNGNWILSGRGMVRGPKIDEESQEEGKVVLDIYVDRTGKVLRATLNVKESNTASQELISRAKKAALKTKFSELPSATVEQKGKLTFNFITQ